ncbi:hypothetical protein PIB30_014634 [Stylosanthes scabra]|uniref:Retrotransposon gag domain-containing protein n=1 Tax=Stylosanthes scabra TaxID=79078 RepID=A0ABU6S6L6_9FABA|nr:hypothetical protein [Stylosanthes scabra]
MVLYDGTSDPCYHLSNLRSRMYLAGASDATRCKAFPTTLTKAFSIQKEKVKHAPSLLGVKQKEGESLRAYMERFNKRRRHNSESPLAESGRGTIKEAEKSSGRRNTRREARRNTRAKPENITHTHHSKSLWWRCIENVEKLPTPRLIRSRKTGNKDEYCEYHRVYGHHTNESYDLKNVVEKLAREGKLDRFIKSEGPPTGDNRRGDRSNDRRSDDRPQDNNSGRSEARHMYTISGGFPSGGSSKSS